MKHTQQQRTKNEEDRTYTTQETRNTCHDNKKENHTKMKKSPCLVWSWRLWSSTASHFAISSFLAWITLEKEEVKRGRKSFFVDTIMESFFPFPTDSNCHGLRSLSEISCWGRRDVIEFQKFFIASCNAVSCLVQWIFRLPLIPSSSSKCLCTLLHPSLHPLQ